MAHAPRTRALAPSGRCRRVWNGPGGNAGRSPPRRVPGRDPPSKGRLGRVSPRTPLPSLGGGLRAVPCPGRPPGRPCLGQRVLFRCLSGRGGVPLGNLQPVQEELGFKALGSQWVLTRWPSASLRTPSYEVGTAQRNCRVVRKKDFGRPYLESFPGDCVIISPIRELYVSRTLNRLPSDRD